MHRVVNPTPEHDSFSSGGSGGLCGRNVVHSVGKGSHGVLCVPQRDAEHPSVYKNGGHIAHMNTSSLSRVQQRWCSPLKVEVGQYGCLSAPGGKAPPLGRAGWLRRCGLPPGGACNPAGCCTASHTPGSGRAACWLGGSPAAGSSDGPAGGTWSNRRNSTGSAGARGLWPRAGADTDKTHEDSPES